MSDQKLSSRLGNALSSMKAAVPAKATVTQPREPLTTTHRRTTASGYPLTREQVGILESGARKIKVQAYAGTGKTTLLRAFAQQTYAAKGLYLAFNNSIASQGRTLFPENVQCKTHNSLALRELGVMHPGWRNIALTKLDTPRSEHLTTLCLSNNTSPALVLAMIQRYIYSRDTEIQPLHFPLEAVLFLHPEDPPPDIQAHALVAQHVWNAMCDPYSSIPMPHDGCLKMWSLAPRKLPFDYILIDESQDSNPAFLQAIEQQNCRLIYVGDEHQGIYGFRGAINALSHVTECDERSLTETHRFGPRLAMLANEVILSKNCKPLLRSSQNTPDTEVVMGQAPLGTTPLFLARTNAGLFEQALSFSQQGKCFTLVGDAKKFTFPDLFDLLELRDKTGKGAYAAYQDLDELQAAAEDQDRNDLAMRVRIAQKYGTKLPSMLATINKQLGALTTAQLDGDIARLSTLHQAKGLESDWVELLDDFLFAPGASKTKDKDKSPPRKNESEESNVLYVAITRARRGLSIRSKEVASWAQSVMSQAPDRPTESGDDSLFG